MAFYYYEETTYYRRKPEEKKPEHGPLEMFFGIVIWIFIIAAMAKGCHG